MSHHQWHLLGGSWVHQIVSIVDEGVLLAIRRLLLLLQQEHLLLLVRQVGLLRLLSLRIVKHELACSCRLWLLLSCHHELLLLLHLLLLLDHLLLLLVL